jgi:hypothetical protein
MTSRPHVTCADTRSDVRNEIKWLKTAKVCRGLRADTRPLGPGHRRHVVGGDEEDEGAGGFASDYSTEDE